MTERDHSESPDWRRASAMTQRILGVLGIGLLAIGAWWAAVRLFSIPQYLLPSPVLVFTDAAHNYFLLMRQAAVTCAEAFAGFLIANSLAVMFAVFITFIPGMDDIVIPFAIGLKTTPVVAMAPLLLLWFGNGLWPKIAAAALICFFPALVNSIKGLAALLPGELDLFKVYGASKTEILWKLRIPRAAPYIFSAFKVSSSLSIVGAIIGEFVGANRGVGYEILVSSYHLNTVRMFSALAFTMVAGVLFYWLICYSDRRVVFWLNAPTDDVRLDSPRSVIHRKRGGTETSS